MEPAGAKSPRLPAGNVPWFEVVATSIELRANHVLNRDKEWKTCWPASGQMELLQMIQGKSMSKWRAWQLKPLELTVRVTQLMWPPQTLTEQQSMMEFLQDLGEDARQQ